MDDPTPHVRTADAAIDYADDFRRINHQVAIRSKPHDRVVLLIRDLFDWCDRKGVCLLEAVDQAEDLYSLDRLGEESPAVEELTLVPVED